MAPKLPEKRKEETPKFSYDLVDPRTIKDVKKDWSISTHFTPLKHTCTSGDSCIKVVNLFETFEDSSSEYTMSKIRLNESEFVEFFKDLDSTEVQIIGLYGEF